MNPDTWHNFLVNMATGGMSENQAQRMAAQQASDQVKASAGRIGYGQAYSDSQAWIQKTSPRGVSASTALWIGAAALAGGILLFGRK